MFEEFAKVQLICSKFLPIKLDFILTITLKDGRWFMNYFDKSTKKAIDLPFHGFMYND